MSGSDMVCPEDDAIFQMRYQDIILMVYVSHNIAVSNLT